MKFKLSNHNFDSFNSILKKHLEDDDENFINFLFDISHGSPGFALKLLDQDIFNLYNEILHSLIDNNPFSMNNIALCEKVSQFHNDKFKIYLSLLKFILLNISKIQIGINISDHYFSNNINELINFASKVSKSTIIKRLEYLIKNENDLFNYNLDKKFFILNFYAKVN